jgi:hypothetical protein
VADIMLVDLLRRFQDEVAAHLADDDPALMQTFGRLTATRANRLDATRRRLEAELGPKHPRVLALEERRAYLVRLAEEVDEVARRRVGAHPPRPQEWLVQGRVVDARGAAVPDLRIRFVTRGSDVELPDHPVTDRRGEFTMRYHISDFGDLGESQAQVDIVVATAQGQVLVTSDTPVHPAAGQSDVVEIVLAHRPRDDGTERERCAATTAKGDPCRNLAGSGSRFCRLHREDREPRA